LTQSVEQKRPSTHTVLNTAHTLSMYHIHYCGHVSLYYMRMCVCVCVCVCVFPLLRISQCHYETSSIVTSCQFSRNQKQATGVNTFLRFGSLAEGEQAQIAQGRSGDEKA